MEGPTSTGGVHSSVARISRWAPYILTTVKTGTAPKEFHYRPRGYGYLSHRAEAFQRLIYARPTCEASCVTRCFR